MRMPWWKWILSTFVIFSIWIYGAVFIAFGVDHLIRDDTPWETLLRDLVTFIPLFIATPLVWRLATKRPVTELINVSGHVHGARIWRGFAVWFVLSTVGTIVDFALHSSDYRITFNAQVFVPFLLVTLVLLPVQCWAEEFFFRGWILRWATRGSLLSRAVISGLVFAAPHIGNPEAAQQTLLALASWFVLGAGWAYASARAGGIELAMGAHLANNVFSLLFVGYADAALPTASIVSTGSLNLSFTFIAIALSMPVFVRLTRK